MAATVRKLQVEGTKAANELGKMIDEAGRLRDEKNDLEKAYNDLRKKIEFLMPMGKKPSIEEEGVEYCAVRKYGTEQWVDVEKLFKANKPLFFSLAKISISDLEGALGKAEAFEFLNMKESDAPSLRILPLKKKKS